MATAITDLALTFVARVYRSDDISVRHYNFNSLPEAQAGVAKVLEKTRFCTKIELFVKIGEWRK